MGYDEGVTAEQVKLFVDEQQKELQNWKTRANQAEDRLEELEEAEAQLPDLERTHRRQDQLELVVSTIGILVDTVEQWLRLVGHHKKCPGNRECVCHYSAIESLSDKIRDLQAGVQQHE